MEVRWCWHWHDNLYWDTPATVTGISRLLLALLSRRTKTKKSVSCKTLSTGFQFVVAMAASWSIFVHGSWCCLLPGQIHCISVQNRCGFPFFRGCHDGVAGFAMYFHRYLYSCPSECSAVPRLQGNLTSAQIRSFILDFNNPFDRRLVSIC